MKNVLVTGGAGFIGSNFVRFLMNMDEHISVVNLDLLTYAGNLKNLEGLPNLARHKFIQGDIDDAALVASLLEEHHIDTIIHFAAETHVDRSIARPDQFIKTNINGTFSLLDAAYKFWMVDKAFPEEEVRFHHISTDEVFGALILDDPPCTEDSPYAPNSPYAASKAASDHLVRAYAHTYGLPVTITNCTNNYGPYQYPEKLIPLMVLNALQGLPLPIYGDGQQKRDWLYVGDHCEAIYQVVKHGRLGEMYNIAGNTDITNLDVVNMLCSILDELLPESKFTPHEKLIANVEDRPGHDFRYALNSAKIRNELGWEPKHSLETGMLETVEWYLSNPEWVAEIQGQPSYQEWMQQNYENRGNIK